MHHEAGIVIDRPIEEVFRLTIDHVAQWSIIVVEDEVLEEMPGGVGTTFRNRDRRQGKTHGVHGDRDRARRAQPARHSLDR